MEKILRQNKKKKLCNLYPDSLVFTYSWPSSLKPFYIMPKGENKDAKLTEGFDALMAEWKFLQEDKEFICQNY